jgi:GTP-binding nuclear protein Ran
MGRLVYNVWDTAGQERFGGLREGYYLEANCAIIMFDVAAPATYRNVSSWHRDLVHVCPNIPIVLVANKIDARERKVPSKRVKFHKKNNMCYFEISTKSNYHSEMPLLAIARHLTGNPQLTFTTAPVKLPPDVILDPVLQTQYEQELEAAEAIPLPEDHHDFLA